MGSVYFWDWFLVTKLTKNLCNLFHFLGLVAKPLGIFLILG